MTLRGYLEMNYLVRLAETKEYYRAVPGGSYVADYCVGLAERIRDHPDVVTVDELDQAERLWLQGYKGLDDAIELIYHLRRNLEY